jgi:uncharacterized MAPEG superfamily protein
MTTELTMLAWTLVLALVQVFLPVGGKTMVWGSKWNAGPRDETPTAPLPPVTGRLDRAQANLYETLPVFIAAILIAHVADRNTASTALGAMLYFWARLAYVPLYAFGVPYVRSIAFVVSFIGLVLILLSIFGVV